MRHIYVYLFPIFILFSCKTKVEDNDVSKKYTSEHFYQELHTNGYRFYKKINLYDRIGINKIDFKNIEDVSVYPFYGIKYDSTNIEIITFCSSSYNETTNYWINENYLLSVDIYKDDELAGLRIYNRTVVIINKFFRIEYTYYIQENKEELSDIKFIYKDGKEKDYSNSIASYQDYDVNLKEEELIKKFPTFKLDQKLAKE